MFSCFWTVGGELELSPVELEEARAAALLDPTWAAFLVPPTRLGRGMERREQCGDKGKNNDGYFTHELFLQQVDRALLIARWEILYALALANFHTPISKIRDFIQFISGGSSPTTGFLGAVLFTRGGSLEGDLFGVSISERSV